MVGFEGFDSYVEVVDGYMSDVGFVGGSYKWGCKRVAWDGRSYCDGGGKRLDWGRDLGAVGLT